MADSLKASQQGLKIIDQARRKKGWTKDAPAWQDEALKLTKENVGRSTLQRFWKQTPIRQALFVSICKAVGIEDWESIVDLPSTSPSPESPNFSVYNAQTWVGRSQLIDEILPKLQDKTRAVWITGIPGIGKTTLGECLASRAWDTNPSFQWIYLEVLEGQGSDFTTIAAELLSKLGETNLDPQERNDPKRLTDRLIRKLQANFYWVQLDSLERLLDSEQGTSFADEYWVTFLQRCLTEPQFYSRLVLTAQALPSGLVEFTDRYPNAWESKTLSGLLANDEHNEHLEFFCKHDVMVNAETQGVLCQLGQVYEGHALVLQVMCGEIHADYGGDAARYWAVNQQEFEQVARSLDSKRLDETEYNDELDRRVRERVKKSLQQLPTDAQDLLLRSSVYRRPVPKKFWLAMIDDRSSSQQKEAYRVLCDRALMEKEGTNIRQHNLIRDVAYDLLNQASAIWKTAEYKAAKLWLTSYEPAPNMPNIETVRGYLEAFGNYCEVGDWDSANSLSTQKIEILGKFNLSDQLRIWGYFQEEIFLFQKLLGKCGLDIDQKCWYGIGVAHIKLANYPKAIESLENYLNIARKLGDSLAEGMALGNLGIVHKNLGQYNHAIDCYQQALFISRQIGHRKSEGTALGNLGVVYKSLEQYDKAIDYHQQHLMISQEIGDRQGESNALCNQGVAYYGLGDYVKAISYYHKYLIISREIGDRRSEAIALVNVGATQFKLNQYSESLDSNQVALDLFREAGVQDGMAESLKNLAEVHQVLGNVKVAQQYCQQALLLATNLGIPLAKKCRKLQEEIEARLSISSG